jgi:hypothetical protein
MRYGEASFLGNIFKVRRWGVSWSSLAALRER